MAADTRLDQMKALVKAHYDAGINNQDLTLIDEQLTDDFIDHSMPPGTPKGPEPVKAWLAQVKTTFPDLQVVFDDVVAEGDLVAVRATWTGTHSAEFLGVPASGKKVTFTGAVFWRFEGDRIAERWAHIDRMAVAHLLQGEG